MPNVVRRGSRAEPAQVAAAGEHRNKKRPLPNPPADDAVAACGAVLVMPEGGSLEDAIQSVKPAPAPPVRQRCGRNRRPALVCLPTAAQCRQDPEDRDLSAFEKAA